jgi:DNA-directed RNA polymerase specialized sigma subunit
MKDEKYNAGFRIIGKDQKPVEFRNLEDRGTEFSSISPAQSLMGEAIEHLQGRQKEVYHLTMRDGKSLAAAGKILGISKDTAKDYKERAIKFITAYCRAVIHKGDSNGSV